LELGLARVIGRLVLEKDKQGVAGLCLKAPVLRDFQKADKGGDLLPARAFNARGCAYLSSTSAPASSS
jgi:hypothetical protein